MIKETNCQKSLRRFLRKAYNLIWHFGMNEFDSIGQDPKFPSNLIHIVNALNNPKKENLMYTQGTQMLTFLTVFIVEVCHQPFHFVFFKSSIFHHAVDYQHFVLISFFCFVGLFFATFCRYWKWGNRQTSRKSNGRLAQRKRDSSTTNCLT